MADETPPKLLVEDGESALLTEDGESALLTEGEQPVATYARPKKFVPRRRSRR